jgi:hypothetical protein
MTVIIDIGPNLQSLLVGAFVATLIFLIIFGDKS